MKGWTTLVAAETLAVALSRPDVVLVDCRFMLNDPRAGELAWLQGRLPGAAYAHLERDLSGPAAPGAGRHPLPELKTFLANLIRWGVTPESQIVAYDAADGSMAAARFWWLMRLLGHAKVAVLDGGYRRWTTLGLPVDTQVKRLSPGYYSGHFDLSQVVDAAELEARMGEPQGWLIDARAGERFRGEDEPIDRVAGHVPGAVNRPYTENIGPDGRMLPPSALADAFRGLLAGTPSEKTVLMCGSGVTACHNLLAMERAGLRGARLYAGSWSGWISDHARPVATGATGQLAPRRVQQG